MPKEPTWWVRLVTALLLAAGLTGLDHASTVATLPSLAQTGWFLFKHHSVTSFPVPIRAAYTALLFVRSAPLMRLLYWLPAAGTFAFVLS